LWRNGRIEMLLGAAVLDGGERELWLDSRQVSAGAKSGTNKIFGHVAQNGSAKQQFALRRGSCCHCWCTALISREYQPKEDFGIRRSDA
jgi:hypothetical protein